jgi:hypothetical protein
MNFSTSSSKEKPQHESSQGIKGVSNGRLYLGHHPDNGDLGTVQ